MDIKERIKGASLKQLITWWDGEKPEWAEKTSLFHHWIAVALGEAGPKGTEFLKSQINSDDLFKRTRALERLAVRGIVDEDIVNSLIELFERDDHRCKTFALANLVRVKQFPLARAEVESLRDHDDGWLAAESMVYLSHACPSDAVNVLRAALQSAKPEVRGGACSEIGFRNIFNLKDEAAALLTDDDVYVANSAQIACEMFDLYEATE